MKEFESISNWRIKVIIASAYGVSHALQFACTLEGKNSHTFSWKKIQNPTLFEEVVWRQGGGDLIY